MFLTIISSLMVGLQFYLNLTFNENVLQLIMLKAPQTSTSGAETGSKRSF